MIIKYLRRRRIWVSLFGYYPSRFCRKTWLKVVACKTIEEYMEKRDEY